MTFNSLGERLPIGVTGCFRARIERFWLYSQSVALEQELPPCTTQVKRDQGPGAQNTLRVEAIPDHIRRAIRHSYELGSLLRIMTFRVIGLLLIVHSRHVTSEARLDFRSLQATKFYFKGVVLR
jgi:hypothetical protein